MQDLEWRGFQMLCTAVRIVCKQFNARHCAAPFFDGKQAKRRQAPLLRSEIAGHNTNTSSGCNHCSGNQQQRPRSKPRWPQPACRAHAPECICASFLPSSA